MTAIHCDAIKIAYRQSKDGFVVSFAIHPQDMPAVLANADIGSQWRLVLSELDEHGNAQSLSRSGPASRQGQGESLPPDNTHSDQPHNEGGGTKRKSWHEMTPAQQAGILCDDPAFRKFLGETYPEQDGFTATGIIYNICGIKSRTEIIPGSKANNIWREITSDYRMWQLEASVVP